MSRRGAWLCEGVLLVLEPDGTETDGARAFATPTGGKLLAVPGLPALPAELEEGLTDLKTFLRGGPAGWDAPTRTRLLGFLASLGAELGLSPALSDGLRQAREALRERRPLSLPGRRRGLGLAVERLHLIDERSFYVRGRAWDETGPVAALSAISPEGERVELRGLVAPHPGAEGGFAGLFETANPTRGAEGWVFEVASGAGSAVEVPASLSPDPLRTIFADAGLEFAGAEALRERHIRPAVARLVELRRAAAGIVELGSHGSVPESPEISLVIPLQRRIDLIEHQIAQFAADPEVVECEVLYVLEEPDRSDAVQELGRELFALYGLPFRLATLTGSGGLSLACDLGASIARGTRLVFLGSDVLPDRPGWLSALAAALDTGSTVSAATPKLLYPDEAIDQAGLEHAEGRGGGESLRHRLRGMHRDLPAAAEGGAVAAASLACLMIEAADLAEAGGLRGAYGLAEYEGSDLSLRLAQEGREVRYVPEAELYRLEGLGADPEPLGEAYAGWLHSRVWASAAIEAVA
jgi:GT2 family glycosyltransferase